MLAHALTPILNVSDMAQSFEWFAKLGWEKGWDWGDPPSFGGVCSGKCEIFLCLDGQGGRGRRQLDPGSSLPDVEQADQGVWISIWLDSVDEVDAVHAQCVEHGLEVLRQPQNMSWNVREMLLRHPDGHCFRVGCGTEHDA